jgi:hypothetical protein
MTGQGGAGVLGSAGALMLNLETVIWDLSWEEYGIWRRVGLGDCSFAEYHAQVDAQIEQAYAQGRPVVLLAAKVAAVVAELRSMEREGDPTAVAEALLAIYGRTTLAEVHAQQAGTHTAKSRDELTSDTAEVAATRAPRRSGGSSRGPERT